MKITIKNKEVSLAFDFTFFEKLQEQWQLTSIQSLFSAFGEKLAGREFDAFVDIVFVASLVAGVDGVERKDAGNWVMQNADRWAELSKAIEEAFPKPEEAGKNRPAKKLPEKSNP